MIKLAFPLQKDHLRVFTRYVGFSILKCISYVPIMSDEVCTLIYNSVPCNCFLNLEVFDVWYMFIIFVGEKKNIFF